MGELYIQIHIYVCTRTLHSILTRRAWLQMTEYIYMYICPYIYIFIHVSSTETWKTSTFSLEYIYKYGCIYIHIHIYIYTCQLDRDVRGIHFLPWIYIYIWIYMNIYIYIYINTWARKRLGRHPVAPLDKYIYIYEYTCIYIHMYTYMQARLWLKRYPLSALNKYTYMNIYMYTYTHTYVHTCKLDSEAREPSRPIANGKSPKRALHLAQKSPTFYPPEPYIHVSDSLKLNSDWRGLSLQHLERHSLGLHLT